MRQETAALGQTPVGTPSQSDRNVLRLTALCDSTATAKICTEKKIYCKLEAKKGRHTPLYSVYIQLQLVGPLRLSPPATQIKK
jgi:hypothetical protein